MNRAVGPKPKTQSELSVRCYQHNDPGPAPGSLHSGGEGNGHPIGTRRLRVPKPAPATDAFKAHGPDGAVLLC